VASTRTAGNLRNLDCNGLGIAENKDARHFLSKSGTDVDATAGQVEGKFLSAFIRAAKPQPACCESGCCSPAVTTLES
jgi:arsenite methyltransferase